MTKHEPFIMLPHAVYDSPTFGALKPIHIAALLLVIRKHNGHNNGDIPLGLREVEKRCNCSRATAGRALKRLQTDGLISATYKGHLVPEIGRPNVATRWRLNFIEEKPSERCLTREPSGRCLTREPSGWFPSETSLDKPVRFSSETSPRVSPENQYKDYLTAEVEAEVHASPRDDEPVRVMARPRGAPSGDGLGKRNGQALSAGSRKRRLRGKPNGFDGTRK